MKYYILNEILIARSKAVFFSLHYDLKRSLGQSPRIVHWSVIFLVSPVSLGDLTLWLVMSLGGGIWSVFPSNFPLSALSLAVNKSIAVGLRARLSMTGGNSPASTTQSGCARWGSLALAISSSVIGLL